jgi:hypothetical protein
VEGADGKVVLGCGMSAHHKLDAYTECHMLMLTMGSTTLQMLERSLAFKKLCCVRCCALADLLLAVYCWSQCLVRSVECAVLPSKPNPVPVP